MSQPPIDWDNYQIPLDPPGGKKSSGLPPSDPKEPPRVRPIGGGPSTGRRAIAILLWCIGGLIVAGAGAFGLALLFQDVLYEQLWGTMPATEPTLTRWLDERTSMTRVAAVFGGIVGVLVKLLHGFCHRND